MTIHYDFPIFSINAGFSADGSKNRFNFFPPSLPGLGSCVCKGFCLLMVSSLRLNMTLASILTGVIPVQVSDGGGDGH